MSSADCGCTDLPVDPVDHDEPWPAPPTLAQIAERNRARVLAERCARAQQLLAKQPPGATP
jgi:hypothetical protein